MARPALSSRRAAVVGVFALCALLCGPSPAAADTPKRYALNAEPIDLRSPTPPPTLAVGSATAPDPDEPPPHKPEVLPYDGTRDNILSCGLLTDLNGIGGLCEFGFRMGELVYFVENLGYQQITTSRDGRASKTYRGFGAPIGLGFAIHPTRALSFYPELGAYFGIWIAPDFVPNLGGFLGLSSDYRPSGWSWGAGINYRLQTTSYNSFSDVGLVHVFSLAFTKHFEDDRAN